MLAVRFDIYYALSEATSRLGKAAVDSDLFIPNHTCPRIFILPGDSPSYCSSKVGFKRDAERAQTVVP